MATPITILVIDDEALIGDFIAEVLEEEGYRVVTAVGGAQALTILASLNPQLILMDMFMPGMSAMELLEQFRVAPGWRPIPVMLMSASASVDALVLQHGFAGFLVKPFDIDVLLERVKEVLARFVPGADGLT